MKKTSLVLTVLAVFGVSGCMEWVNPISTPAVAPWTPIGMMDASGQMDGSSKLDTTVTSDSPDSPDTSDTPFVGPRLVPLCVTAEDDMGGDWGMSYTLGTDAECKGLPQLAWWDKALKITCRFKTWDPEAKAWTDGGDRCLPLTTDIVMPNGDKRPLVNLLGGPTYFRSLTPCGAGKPVPLFKVDDPKSPPQALDLPVKYGFDYLTGEWWALADADGNVVPATGTAYSYVVSPAAECKVFGLATELGYPAIVPTSDVPLDPTGVFATAI